jgi:hypothetical protein
LAASAFGGVVGINELVAAVPIFDTAAGKPEN